MKFLLPRSGALTLVGACLCGLPAQAAVRSAGGTFVYELTIASDTQTDFSGLPANVRGQAAAMQAAANKTPVRYVFTLVTDGVGPDGSAHVNVSFTNSLEAGHGSAAVFTQFNQFEGALTNNGEFLHKFDPSMPLTAGAGGMSPPNEIHNAKAEQMAPLFADFNTFARGCAARRRMKPGDAWQVTSQDRFGIPRSYQFAATGGPASAPTVTMKGDFSSGSSSSSVEASGHYDGTRGLLLDLHENTIYRTETPNGITSTGKSVMDFALRR